MNIKTSIALVALLFSVGTAAAETHFFIDSSGSKPRGYTISVDSSAVWGRCVGVYRSGLFGRKWIGKGYIVPHHVGELMIGETSQEGHDHGPVLVWRDRQDKNWIVGDAWNLTEIRLEDGFLLEGNKFRGNILAPGGESVHVKTLSGHEFTEFTGRVMDVDNIDEFIKTAEAACESGDPALGSCENLEVLLNLKKSFEAWKQELANRK